MSTVYTIGVGRTVELYRNVKRQLPSADSAFIVLLLRDPVTVYLSQRFDQTLADVLGAHDEPAVEMTEATNDGYERKRVVAADLAAFPGPANFDETGSYAYTVRLPTIIWPSVQPGDAIAAALVCYTEEATPSDDEIIPLAVHDDVYAEPNGEALRLRWLDNSGFGYGFWTAFGD